jgi:hypothetical protein
MLPLFQNYVSLRHQSINGWRQTSIFLLELCGPYMTIYKTWIPTSYIYQPKNKNYTHTHTHTHKTKISAEFLLYFHYQFIDSIVSQPTNINHNTCPIIWDFHNLTITSTSYFFQYSFNRINIMIFHRTSI